MSTAHSKERCRCSGCAGGGGVSPERSSDCRCRSTGAVGVAPGPHVLVLEHRGSEDRRAPLDRGDGVDIRRHTREAVICSAWGERPDWVRNIRAVPAVRIQLGRETFAPEQRFLAEDESLAVVAEFRRRHPWRLGLIAAIFGWDDLRSDRVARNSSAAGRSSAFVPVSVRSNRTLVGQEARRRRSCRRGAARNHAGGAPARAGSRARTPRTSRTRAGHAPPRARTAAAGAPDAAPARPARRRCADGRRGSRPRRYGSSCRTSAGTRSSSRRRRGRRRARRGGDERSEVARHPQAHVARARGPARTCCVAVRRGTMRPCDGSSRPTARAQTASSDAARANEVATCATRSTTTARHDEEAGESEPRRLRRERVHEREHRSDEIEERHRRPRRPHGAGDEQREQARVDDVHQRDGHDRHGRVRRAEIEQHRRPARRVAQAVRIEWREAWRRWSDSHPWRAFQTNHGMAPTRNAATAPGRCRRARGAFHTIQTRMPASTGTICTVCHHARPTTSPNTATRRPSGCSTTRSASRSSSAV